MAREQCGESSLNITSQILQRLMVALIEHQKRRGFVTIIHDHEVELPAEPNHCTQRVVQPTTSVRPFPQQPLLFVAQA